MHLPQPTQTQDFEIPPAGGPYVAICTRFIDLGTQFSEAYNKTAHKIMIGWELADMADSQNRPFQIAKRYTFSMHAKSQLRRDLEAWRGTPFQDKDFGPNGFNCSKLLGKGCQMIIAHSEGQQADRVYANVGAIMAMGRGMVTPEPVSPLEYLALTPDEFDQAVYGGLSDGLKRIIEQSPEYRKIMGITSLQGVKTLPHARPGPTPPPRPQSQSYAAAERAIAPKQQQRHEPAHETLTAELNDEIPF